MYKTVYEKKLVRFWEIFENYIFIYYFLRRQNYMFAEIMYLCVCNGIQYG